MTSKYKTIGSFISLIDDRNIDLKVKNILGLNINKEFMPTIANTTNLDISNYKIIRKNQFAYSSMQTGRDETIRVALYNYDKPAVISPAYSVFKINDKKELLEDFLMCWFLRPESDRYDWFISDGTVRASLEWDRFCEIEIPNINILLQKKYSDVLKFLNNKTFYLNKKANLLEKIQKVFLRKLIKKNKKELLGPHIKENNLINNNNTNNVRGISSIYKKFIKTKANMSGVDINGYKIVQYKNFAFNPNTARMGDRIPIALNLDKDCLVSKIYPVFKVIDETTLNSQFLSIWFGRSEFDRYARFNSWGSARETFNYTDMKNVPIIVPSILDQNIMIKINTIYEKILYELNQIEKMIPKLSPVLMKGAINCLK